MSRRESRLIARLMKEVETQPPGKPWTVVVEPPDGSEFQYKKTLALTPEEACANIRAKIPASWRIVGVEERERARGA